MIIANYYVQHILKTYSQQLSVRSRVSKDKGNGNSGQRDQVTLSLESKKRMMVDKITHEIINQMANGSEQSDNGREIMRRLSQEYGRPLDVDGQNGSGMTFKVLNETGQGVTEYLSSQENEQLKRKLIDITQSFVYSQLT